MSGALTDGLRFRILAVVDDYSRENFVLVADTSLSGHRVKRELDRIIAERGMPKTLVSGNGTEFTSMAILKWVQDTLDRQFDVDAASSVWVTDITYVKTPPGFSYLAVLIDLFSRRFVGW